MMYDITMEENLSVTMRDDVRLRVDVHRPKGRGRFPALLSVSPYGKEKQRYYPKGIFPKVEAGNTEYFVSRGYVHVIADVRGKSPSEGQWNLCDEKEQQDGYEFVEWIARQPWCDGNVAMIGESYFAQSQYLVAAMQPPSLKTIIPFDGWTDLYRDVVYQGGIYNVGFMPYWLATVYETCLPKEEPPSAKWLPPHHVVLDTVLHSTDGPYYWERSAYTKFNKITVPIYHMANAGTLYIHFRGQLLAYTEINTPKKLLVGTGSPWLLSHSPSLCQQIVRWLDYWLKGIDTTIMEEPPVLLYVTGSDEWRYEFEYPLARTRWSKLYLHTGEKGPASEPPYGLLSEEMPGDEMTDRFDHPDSHRMVTANLPVLGYATPPLISDMEVIGPVSLVLYAASSANDMAWIVKIDDVAPDGSVTVVSKGWLKASHREVDETRSRLGQPFHPHTDPTPIEPDKVYRYDIEIWPIFRVFKAGHRLRLRVGSSDSLVWDPVNFHYTVFQTAKNTVYHNSECPSHLVLPMIPAGPPVTELRPAIDYQPRPPVIAPG